MTSRKLPIPILICLLLTFGCINTEQQRHKESSETSMLTRSSSAPPAPGDAADSNAESRRFIAMRHNVLVETAETDLQKAWESVAQFCETIHCEVIASSIRRKTYDSPPSATLSLRVAPEETGPLFGQLGKAGEILEHRADSEDKTSSVIDVEAKIKNLVELRDRLRKMLASPNGSLKDVVEVERELSRAQSELDSLQMRRKALANETEKVSVDISFRSRKSIAETGAFAPIATAWREAGHVLAESIGFVITFVVAVIPWLVIFMPVIWLLTKAFRKLRRRRTTAQKT